MTAAPAGAAPAQRRLAPRTMLSYGFGAVAYGVKDNGFGTFLLLFYNQVLGLPAATVGLVIMIALVADAVVDISIGFLSDRTRSRWGRRHPWMYGSAVPIAVGWLLIWNPPALSEPLTLLWLFVTAVIVRSAVSAYEVPSQALTAELTSDYDERTRITAYRYLFGWAGGLAMLLAAYTIFLPTDASHPKGLLERAGYTQMAWVAALVMLIAILTSAIGTHPEIRRLPKSPANGTLGASLGELGATLRNRGFIMLMGAGLMVYTNQGISFALSNYLYTYVWQFQKLAFVLLIFALFAGATLAFIMAPRIGRRLGKPRAAAGAMVGAVLLLTLPYWLRLAGWFPAPGDARMLPVLLSIFVLNNACSVSSMILGASMMADVVEDSEARTGRRSEGVFFAGGFFIQKCTSGFGIALAGLILAIANFPAAARPGQVPLAAVDRLTIVFILAYTLFGLTGAFLYSRFPFGRTEHNARLAGLAAAEREGAPHAP
ncbi:MFS transporter [Sphingomonas hylomeconis]|uniref:MFS transporter n=1 Tax=Sphingomonas hylomeconis TaxID=1395958 RepID=A0ABV7SSA4_9SPHN|nr:MFS transporter [Sphingomonas hylomeconis]